MEHLWRDKKRNKPQHVRATPDNRTQLPSIELSLLPSPLGCVDIENF